MLKTEVTENGNEAKIMLEGKIDANTAKELKSRIEQISGNVKNIEMDLTKLDYTSSAGLRVILQLHNQLNQNGGRLTVSHANEEIMEVFDDTGLLDCLNIAN